MSSGSPIKDVAPSMMVEEDQRARFNLFSHLIATTPTNLDEAKRRLVQYKNFTDTQFRNLKEQFKALLERASSIPGSSPSRPITSDSTLEERQYFLSTLSTAEEPASKAQWDIITVEFAVDQCNRYRQQIQNITTPNPLGCWVSPLAQGHNAGYTKINLRNTKINGKTVGFQPWLHQLALIGAGRREELYGALKGSGKEVSHLCHNAACFNPNHLVVEPAADNKDRNTCHGHKTVRYRDFVYNPCRHGKGAQRKRCLLPEEEYLDGGYYINS